MLEYNTYYTLGKLKWLKLSIEQSALIANMNGLLVGEVAHLIIALNAEVN